MMSKWDRRRYNPPDHLQAEYGSRDWAEKWFDFMFPTMSSPDDPYRKLWLETQDKLRKRNDE